MKRNIDYQSFLVFYLAEIVGGEISDVGLDEDEKEYAREAQWVEFDRLKDMRFACNLDIAEELLGLIKKGIE